MKLSTLLNDYYPVDASFDCEIRGLSQNSRQVQQGFLFLACPGKTVDGRQYIDEAIAKGAIAVLVEGLAASSLTWYNKTPLLQLPLLRQKLDGLAARFFNYPGEKLKLIGVTGTNGKTSCSHFMAQVLQDLGLTCGVIGTLGSGISGALKETGMTTPDAISLQKVLADFVAEQARYVSMEVSSHSLDQGRIGGLAFEVGIFTNLTQDHLDYHGTMTAYGAAKKRFFTDYEMRHAVINADDAFGRELIASLAPEKVVAYSLKKSQIPPVDRLIYVQALDFSLSGVRAEVFTPWGEGELRVPLIGEFNLSNALAVLASLGVLGLPLAKILPCLSRLRSVPGRMQIFGGGQKPWVIVDYAHTPDALEKTLQALRQHCQGRLACLFGCGGDRDKGKRPKMGAIAEKYADLVMLTDDNPRHEDPAAIIAEIRAGLSRPEQALVQGNRSKAIQDIIQYAGAGDYVLIAGKGAETYQQLGDEKLPFSDAQKIQEALLELE